MTSQTKSIIVPICFLLVILFAAIPVHAEEYAGTVVTKSGEKFTDISFQVNRIYKIVAIKAGAEKKNISFEQVETIYDEKGNDITAAILEDYYKPEAETWKSKDDQGIKKLKRRRWAVGLRPGGNFSLPIGDYYEGIKSGIGYEGSLWIAINRETSVIATISKTGMAFDKAYGFYSIDPEYTIINQNIKFSAVRYLISVQYNTAPVEYIAGKSIFYLNTGMGVINNKISADLTYSYGGQTLRETSSTTQTKFMTEIGGGVMVLILKKVAADFGAAFDIIYLGRGADGGASYAAILDFKFGLTAFL
jgi:hypothetical protein